MLNATWFCVLCKTRLSDRQHTNVDHKLESATSVPLKRAINHICAPSITWNDFSLQYTCTSVRTSYRCSWRTGIPGRTTMSTTHMNRPPPEHTKTFMTWFDQITHAVTNAIWCEHVFVTSTRLRVETRSVTDRHTHTHRRFDPRKLVYRDYSYISSTRVQIFMFVALLNVTLSCFKSWILQNADFYSGGHMLTSFMISLICKILVSLGIKSLLNEMFSMMCYYYGWNLKFLSGVVV